MCFRALALVAPEAGEAGRGTQLKGFGAPVPCDGDRLTILLLCRDIITRAIEHVATQSA
jgi:hypothetical protein